jgi:hypothetical protein
VALLEESIGTAAGLTRASIFRKVPAGWSAGSSPIESGKGASIGEAGLKLQRLEELSARNEDNAPVPGLVAVAAKP